MAWAISFTGRIPTSLNDNVALIQTNLSEAEQHAFSHSIDSLSIEALIKNVTRLALPKPFLFGDECQLAIYEHDSILFWSSNIYQLPGTLQNLNEGTTYQKQKNGSVLYVKKTYKQWPGAKEGLVVLVIVPIQSDYTFSNTFLQNKFLLKINQNLPVKLSEQNWPGSVAINSITGSPLCYASLSAPDSARDQNVSILFILLLTLSCLLFIWSINSWCRQLIVVRNALIGLAVLLCIQSAIWLLVSVVHWPSFLYNFNLFNPQFYGSGTLTHSLGELLIFTLLTLWFFIFLYAYVHIEDSTLRAIKPFGKGLVTFFLSIVTIILCALLVSQIQSLVMDSVISFDVTNMQTLTIFSVVGFLILVIMFTSVALWIRLSIQLIYRLHNNISFELIYLLGSAALYFAVAYWLGYDWIYIGFVSFCLVFILLFRIFAFNNTDASFSGTRYWMVWILLVAWSSSGLLYYFIEKKEVITCERLAQKLSKEQDPVAEYLFSEISRKIKNDLFLKQLLSEGHLVSSKEITHRLTQVYFSGYFNRYSIDFSITDNLDRPVLGDVAAMKTLLANIQTKGEAASNLLNFGTSANDESFYLAVVPIANPQNLPLVTLFVRMRPISYKKENVYPELLLEDRLKPSEEFEKYDYAIYKQMRLIKQLGSYPFPLHCPPLKMKDGSYIDFQDGYRRTFFQDQKNKVVLIVSKQNSILQLILLFSCVLFILIFLIGLLSLGLLLPTMNWGTSGWFQLSIRNKIQLIIFSILTVSFALVSIMMAANYSNQYKKIFQERLSVKTNNVLSDWQYTTASDEQDALKTTSLEDRVQKISATHGVDLNIYNKEGLLLQTSQPSIFMEGLISTRIDPQAFIAIVGQQRSLFIHEEKIGTLAFLSAYAPLTDNQGNIQSVLNIPYFKKERELSQSFSTFIVILINAFLLILLLTFLLTYWITGSFTKSFLLLENKMRAIKLGKKNELIEWHSNDEIGSLVKEYNKMIVQIENSAALLSQNERERAWREMARQVAHEIKNPLTPMKLSLQHLQRVISSESADASALAKKVADTLVEQIDALSEIATRFSQFAKISQTNPSNVSLYSLINNSVELYNGQNGVRINHSHTTNTIEVLVDKNQFVSVFNNLILNAIQAIPEERKGQIDITYSQTDTTVKVCFADNGIGIEEEKRAKIFEPNFTTKNSGTGLGLAITKAIIENAHGKIWFETSTGIGTRFFVELPLVK